MKNLRKFSAVILALTITLSQFSALAAQDTYNSKGDKKIEQLLTSIYSERECYGLDDVSYDNVNLGKEVMAYEVCDKKLQKLDFTFTPVFSDSNELVALITTSHVSSKEYDVQISTSLVDEINNIALTKHKIAFVYDNSAVYLLADGKLTKLCDSNEFISTRDSINTVSSKSLKGIGLTDLKSAKNLVIPEQPTPMTESFATVASSTSANLNVPIVAQGYQTNMCWACCIASTGNYVTGKSYDGYKILNLTGKTEAQTSNLTDTLTYLKNIYGLSYSKLSSVSNTTSNFILTSLNKGYPVIGGFTYSSGGHMVVIKGINVVGTFSVMDPQYGVYTSGTYSPMLGNFKYTNAYTGVSLTLKELGVHL